MSPEERQAAIDNISADDLAKVEAHTKSNKVKVEIEDYLIAEFALNYGWEAYKDFKADLVSGKEMMNLIAGARKLEHRKMYMNAEAVFLGSAAANSKKPSDTFNTITKAVVREAEADK